MKVTTILCDLMSITEFVITLESELLRLRHQLEDLEDKAKALGLGWEGP